MAAGSSAIPKQVFKWGPVAIGILAGIIVVYLVLVPLGILVFSSFRATKGVLPFEATGFTFANYINVFTSSVTYELLWNTILYASLSIVIGLGLALVFAWFLERTSGPGHGLLVALVLAPLGVPSIVNAAAWTLLANPTNGVLNVAIRNLLSLPVTAGGPLNIYSISGMGFVTGISLVPSAYILVASVLGRLDPMLEEASLASGATPLTTMWRITTKLMTPALLGVLIYYGVLTVELFDIPALLGMPSHIFVFSTLIYFATHPFAGGLPDYGLASGYAILNLAIAGGLMYLYHRQVRQQERFTVVTGKGYRPRPATLRKGWQVVFIIAILSYTALAVLFPLLVLVWASLGILYSPGELVKASLGSYRQVLSYPGMTDAIWNTLTISVGCATATVVLALVTSWLAVRSGLRFGSLPDRLTILVLAIPNIVIALCLMFFYSRFPLPVYGTIWIIMIAQITRFMAYTSRVMNASYLQLHRELEEASAASGAGWFSTMIWIVLPILWPAFIRAWLWVFIHSIRDVSIALMLFAVYNNTIGVMFWNLWTQDANYPLAAAIAVPLMLISLGLSLLIGRIGMVKGEQVAP